MTGKACGIAKVKTFTPRNCVPTKLRSRYRNSPEAISRDTTWNFGNHHAGDGDIRTGNLRFSFAVERRWCAGSGTLVDQGGRRFGQNFHRDWIVISTASVLFYASAVISRAGRNLFFVFG